MGDAKCPAGEETITKTQKRSFGQKNLIWCVNGNRKAGVEQVIDKRMYEIYRVIA